MPTYHYRCSNCAHEFEVLQSIKDMSLLLCPHCKQEKLNRVIGLGGGMIFKGSGFYQTDYKNVDSSKKESSPKKDSPTEKKTETTPTTTPSPPASAAKPDTE